MSSRAFDDDKQKIIDLNVIKTNDRLYRWKYLISSKYFLCLFIDFDDVYGNSRNGGISCHKKVSQLSDKAWRQLFIRQIGKTPE